MKPIDLARPAPPASPATTAADRATAQRFEAMFLGEMARIMLASAGDAGEFSGGHGEEMFKGLLADEIGAVMARSGGVGLSPAVLSQIHHMRSQS